MGKETPTFFSSVYRLAEAFAPQAYCWLLLLARIGLLPAAAPTGEKSRHPIEVQFEVEFVVKLTGDIVVGWLR